MTTAYYSFSQHFGHDTGDDHPEHAMRIVAIEHKLQELNIWPLLDRRGGYSANTPDILRAHSPGYFHQLQLIVPEQGRIYVDEDTPMSTGTLEAALYSAGSCVQAVDDILNRDSSHQHAFVAARPPGHHAEAKKSMGFCFFNNIAVAAMRAANVRHLQRIAILDFDAHQGNGTINILANDERFLICSSYQHPFFPHSYYQQGKFNNVINSPLEAESDGAVFRNIVEQEWLAPLKQFAPELILVSAGFDAHRLDPMAELNFCEDDYFWIGEQIRLLAEQRNTPIVSVLEGGYQLTALADSVVAYLRGIDPSLMPD